MNSVSVHRDLYISMVPCPSSVTVRAITKLKGYRLRTVLLQADCFGLGDRLNQQRQRAQVLSSLLKAWKTQATTLLHLVMEGGGRRGVKAESCGATLQRSRPKDSRDPLHASTGLWQSCAKNGRPGRAGSSSTRRQISCIPGQ